MAAKTKKAAKSSTSKAKAKSERNYFLSADQLEKLRLEWKADGGKKSRPPNPHRSGTYRAIVAALIELGVNKGHTFAELKRSMKRQMSLAETRQGEGDEAQTAWERFAGREARSENGKDVAGRIRQNIEVLQRTNDYGAKLIQVGKEILGTKGMTIDTLPGEMVRLSTDSDTPERQLRRPRLEEAPTNTKKSDKAVAKKQVKAKAVTTKAARPKKAKANTTNADEVVAQPCPENADLGQATVGTDLA